MHITRIACIGAAVFAVGVQALAQQAPELSEAEPVAAPAAEAVSSELVVQPAESPVPGATPLRQEVGLRYDQVFDSADRSIRRQIDVDLIDLDALRDALEAQMGAVEVRLSLEDCILLALERNPDILIAQYEPMKADGDVLSARGEFDPVASMDITYNETSIIASQQVRAFGGISSIESFTTSTTTSVSQKLKTGTMWNVSLSMNREQTTFGNFIEEWDGLLTLTLTQPVLRGFGPKVNTVRIRQARNARAMSEEQMRLTVLQTTAQVIKAYWDLVGAIENLKVRQESLANAERLLRINETRREIGTAADIDVLQAKAGVATRQSELIATRSAVGTASDQLKQLIDLRDGDFFSRARVVPTDRPLLDPAQMLEPQRIEDFLQVSMERALENRPEASIAELGIDNAELEELRARNQMLPQLDVVGSYGQGGRDRTPREVFYGMRDGDTDTLTVSVQGSVPLGNRAARGQHLRARISVREAEQQIRNVRQQLMVAVHLAARNLLTNQSLLESTRQAREFQEVSVAAEEKRLRLGVTTSYQVLLVQEDLTAAQTQEVQAMVDFEKARTDLLLAEGTLLEELGVAFEAPDTAEPTGFITSVRPRFPWESNRTAR